MLMHLVKKDLLLAGKYVPVLMVLVIALPLFFFLAYPSVSGFACLFYMVILPELMLMEVVSQEESKYPKAVALLCAAPYRRSLVVAAKYVWVIMFFLYACIAYAAVAILTGPGRLLSLTEVLTVLLMYSAIFGIYMPVEMKYGSVKTKFIFIAIVLLLSLGPSLFGNLLGSIDINGFMSSSSGLKNIVMAGASIAILGVSLLISIGIFNRRDI